MYMHMHVCMVLVAASKSRVWHFSLKFNMQVSLGTRLIPKTICRLQRDMLCRKNFELHRVEFTSNTKPKPVFLKIAQATYLLWAHITLQLAMLVTTVLGCSDVKRNPHDSNDTMTVA